jgi:hypothetical protein
MRQPNSGSWTKGHSPHNKLDPIEKARRLRDRNRRKYFGVSEEKYQELKSEQGPLCAVCNQPMGNDQRKDGRRLTRFGAVLDHNHVTGKPRKFVHNTCNRGMGMFSDDPVLLRMAAAYLEKENSSS